MRIGRFIAGIIFLKVGIGIIYMDLATTSFSGGAGFGVILVIIGIVIMAFSLKKSHAYLCGYCDFYTDKEDKLNSHIQVCEKYQENKNAKDNEIAELKDRIEKLEDKEDSEKS